MDISTRMPMYMPTSRIETAVQNLRDAQSNLTEARSRITDADFASESASFTKNQILQQAGTSMLSQANAMPQSVLDKLA